MRDAEARERALCPHGNLLNECPHAAAACSYSRQYVGDPAFSDEAAGLADALAVEQERVRQLEETLHRALADLRYVTPHADVLLRDRTAILERVALGYGAL